jgi:hypothetical protein
MARFSHLSVMSISIRHNAASFLTSLRTYREYRGICRFLRQGKFPYLFSRALCFSAAYPWPLRGRGTRAGDLGGLLGGFSIMIISRCFPKTLGKQNSAPTTPLPFFRFQRQPRSGSRGGDI